MAAVGLPTRNVDPLACFAEVIAARELGGAIVTKAANPDYDVSLPDGRRVQVKSLRVTTGKLMDNGRSWVSCTRKAEKVGNPLLNADLTALVVFLDHRPYAMLVFPIEDGERFPALNIKDIFYRHAQLLLESKVDLGGWQLQVFDLRGCLGNQC
jgi:hypothetical protein